MLIEQLALSFSPAAGAARRDDGINRAGNHADEAWKHAAYRIVTELSHSHKAFTSDEVWQRLTKAGYSTPEPRAMGAVMLAAARSGLIIKSRSYTPTNRTAANRRPVAIWLSKTFIPQQETI